MQKHIVDQAIVVDGLQRKHGLLNKIPHSLYKDRLQIYDEIWVLLTHMLKMYGRLGVDISRLKISRKNYSLWLEKQKKQFNRNRSLTGYDLDSKFQFMIQTGEFRELIGNDKLTDFLEAVILQRKTLNYKTLKLEDFKTE